jgi:hypothetical protein
MRRPDIAVRQKPNTNLGIQKPLNATVFQKSLGAALLYNEHDKFLHHIIARGISLTLF